MPDSSNAPVALDGLAALDALPVQVALLDQQGTVCWLNQAWKRSAPPGFAPGSGYTQCWAAIHPQGPYTIARLDRALRAIADGEKEFIEMECPEPLTLRLAFAPLRGNGFEGIIVTHTPLPEGENDGYDRRQAEKMEAVGRLVGGVAHDFANLLTLISGYSEIVLNRMHAAEPLRTEIDEIRKAANRGSRLTAQLLGFTRGQAVQPRVLDLNALVFDMEKMLRPIIGEHIEVQTELSPDLGRINADPGQMEQVIMNLVLNARDAMPRGGCLTIETAGVELDDETARAHALAPGAYVKLSLTDTGEGMDAETMSHLFQPFFTTKEKGKGTGLGLSTVYGIVKQNHGDVWARSTPAEGTTFTIYLPRVEAAEEYIETPVHRGAQAGTETILLVEDEDGVRRLLKHILSRQGYTVLEAPDGPEAIECLTTYGGTIHLLLTDMVMPRMSGRDVGDRAVELRPGIKVIYMSGYTDDMLMRAGALGPGMSFIRKPLKVETLTARVREVLDAIDVAPGLEAAT
jgi:signal transduction histidine kinase/CheY-like chemotaxis protein